MTSSKAYKTYVFECWYLKDTAKFLLLLVDADGFLISIGKRALGGVSGLHVITYRCTEELGMEVRT